LRGESFQDDISSFVNSDIDEIIFYRNWLMPVLGGAFGREG